ncbi:MAG: hypothetical protein SFT81_03765 [Candidatus Caenarcaniphilales bacterium]|nr:hypothetical protein [Candidatus Caenarcaniphilales bacterium]
MLYPILALPYRSYSIFKSRPFRITFKLDPAFRFLHKGTLLEIPDQPWVQTMAKLFRNFQRLNANLEPPMNETSANAYRFFCTFTKQPPGIGINSIIDCQEALRSEFGSELQIIRALGSLPYIPASHELAPKICDLTGLSLQDWGDLLPMVKTFSGLTLNGERQRLAERLADKTDQKVRIDDPKVKALLINEWLDGAQNPTPIYTSKVRDKSEYNLCLVKAAFEGELSEVHESDEEYFIDPSLSKTTTPPLGSTQSSRSDDLVEGEPSLPETEPSSEIADPDAPDQLTETPSDEIVPLVPKAELPIYHTSIQDLTRENYKAWIERIYSRIPSDKKELLNEALRLNRKNYRSGYCLAEISTESSLFRANLILLTKALRYSIEKRDHENIVKILIYRAFLRGIYGDPIGSNNDFEQAYNLINDAE